MFMFKTKTFLDELSKYHKNIIQLCKKSLIVDPSSKYVDIKSEEFENVKAYQLIMLDGKTSEAVVLSLKLIGMI